ncbi:unnamed protein product [Mycena citricolor]|uniref:Uncharacterized protein n=1 Tax=Mycena citricolor TaxID=2018698 RepID=A0AAD2GYK4_9AGAR|nr:unnamed protein product [Mycena citricolor]
MYHLLRGLHEYLTRKEEFSTLLEKIKTLYNDTPGLSPDKIGPTVGQNTGTITLPSTILQFWDLGGQRGIRNIWHRYYEDCHAVAYVIDAEDRERLGEGWEVFDSVLSAPQILNIPLLLIANKQDSPQALSVEEIRQDYEEWHQRKIESARRNARSGDADIERRERIASLDVMGISAVEGTGVKAAVDWLFIRVQNSRRDPQKGFIISGSAALSIIPHLCPHANALSQLCQLSHPACWRTTAMTELASLPVYLEPPSYDGPTVSALVQSDAHQQDDLPAYTRRSGPAPTPAATPPPLEFSHVLKKNGTVWATLVIKGDGRLTKNFPTIVEGACLEGAVKLALAAAESIFGVYVHVKGEIINGGPAAVPIAFLDIKHCIWSASEGDPNAGSSTSAPSSSVKLKGAYEWPFAIRIPTTVTYKDGSQYRLPHTYLDKLAFFSVRYTAELRVVRGKLRLNDRTLCNFGYFSMQQPGEPSALRMLAYQENSPLLGPEADPEGWVSVPFTATGSLFSTRDVTVEYKSRAVALAGQTALLHAISIDSVCTDTDLQALDVLSAVQAPSIYLERHVQENSAGFKSVTEVCGVATFWVSPEGAPPIPGDVANDTRRQLMGEIHLRPNLQPTSKVFEFLVEYAVVAFPPTAAGFRTDHKAPLARREVEITTRYAPGPRHITHSKPVYDQPQVNAIVDYYYYNMVLLNATGRARGRGFKGGFT